MLKNKSFCVSRSPCSRWSPSNVESGGTHSLCALFSTTISRKYVVNTRFFHRTEKSANFMFVTNINWCWNFWGSIIWPFYFKLSYNCNDNGIHIFMIARQTDKYRILKLNSSSVKKPNYISCIRFNMNFKMN